MCPSVRPDRAVWPYLNGPRSRGNYAMDRVRIRPIKATDASALETFYAELSADARRARLLGSARGLDAGRACLMCAADNTHEAGFVAERQEAAGWRIVGHVSLTRVSPVALEVAIAVADSCQHKGIGGRLFMAATRWAERNDVGSIVATAFTDNWRVMRLLRRSGHATVVRDVGCGLSSVAISMHDGPALTRAA
jgi:L-amino acid N-acyltransferase YncA